MFDLELLHRLAEAQGLALCPDVATVMERLAGPLGHYAELELRSDGQRIDLITLSDVPEVAETLLSLLAARGSHDTDLAAARALVRFATGATVGMKLPIAGPAAGGEVYLRAALPLAEAEYLLGRYNVASVEMDRLRALGKTFAKDHAHMFAVDVSAAPRFTMFLTTYLHEGRAGEDRALLERALAEVGLPQAAIDASLRLHALLGASRPETLFFSWPIASHPQPPIAKLDYPGLRLGIVAELMAEVGASSQATVLARWSRELGMSFASYAGLVIGETGPVAARAYFTRRA